MSLRTRKSKKQKLNRRKSLKIGGMLPRANLASRGVAGSGRGGPAQKPQNSPTLTPASPNSSSAPPAPSRASGAPSGTFGASGTSGRFPRTPLNPLCNISEGDLVQSRDNEIAYVTEINERTATLSNNGGQKQISDLVKYEYHDILTSLSNILNFVLQSKENVPEEKKSDHITKINAMKESLKKITQ